MNFTNRMMEWNYNHTSMVYHDTWVTWQVYCHSKFSRVWGRLSRRCNVTQLESRRLGSSNKSCEGRGRN